MNIGLSQQEALYIDESVVKPLRRMGAELWVFGSRARLSHNKFSDLDLLIAPKTVAIERLAGTIREQLETENFPYKVDLVFEQDLADSYRQSVARDKVLWRA